MKKLLRKSATNKILIVILIVILFNFIVPNYSHADWGGVLFDPIVDLIAAIGDAVLSALQYFMYDGNVSLNGQNIFSMTVPNLAFSPSYYNLQADPSQVTYKINAKTLDEVSWWTTAWNAIGDFFDWVSFWNGSSSAYDEAVEDSPYGIPLIQYTPDKIFANKIPALDANFITPKTWQGSTTTQTNAMNDRSVTKILHETVASWYVVLRNLAIIILLSVLLYVGIRIVISSTAADKAKYKQMLMDWVVALCLLFFLHYVMSFILTFVETLVDGISSATDPIVVGIYTDENFNTFVQNYETVDINDDGQVTSADKENLIFKTDLTGVCRLLVQSKESSTKLVYLIFYLALVIYTVMFTWTYVKRAITMAFLTLMAPLVAITYPIDKMRDGQAQGFNMWLREFIFNALLQPFHLIIYMIFLGSSMDIAVKNPIYAILFLAFIIPSEKLLRRMFGFDKSETAGSMSTAAGLFGGAAVLKSAGNLVGKLGRGGKGGSNEKSVGKKQIRTKNRVTDPNKPSLTSAFGGSTNGAPSKRLPAGRIPAKTQNTRNGTQQLSQQTQRRQKTLASSNRLRLANKPGQNGERKQYKIKKTGNANNTHDLANNVASTPQTKYKRHPIRGVMRAGGHIVAGTVKTAAKIATPIIGAGIGATVGLAAGIAGDDLEDVLTLGATGTALGATGIPALGQSAIRGATNIVTDKIPGAVRGVRDSYQASAYDPVELALKQQTKELMNDEDYKMQMSQELHSDLGRTPTSRELKSAMKTGAEYYNAGIETKDIPKAMKTEKSIKQDIQEEIKQDIKVEYKSRGMSEEEAEKAANRDADRVASQKAREQSKVVSKMAGKLSETDLRDEKQVNSIKNSIKKQILSKDNGKITDEEADKRADRVIDLIKKQKGV